MFINKVDRDREKERSRAVVDCGGSLCNVDCTSSIIGGGRLL